MNIKNIKKEKEQHITNWSAYIYMGTFRIIQKWQTEIIFFVLSTAFAEVTKKSKWSFKINEFVLFSDIGDPDNEEKNERYYKYNEEIKIIVAPKYGFI